ncbi:MAG: hypothetical protein ACE5JL_10365, partial [Dehalococcoidia bacterium]
MSLIAIALTSLWGGVASAKFEFLKVVISSDSLTAPAEVPPSEIEAFREAWVESFQLRVDAPQLAVAGPVAVIYLWFPPCGSLDDPRPECRPRQEPDWTVEYYRVGDNSYFR